jgi:hypothetical protein
MLLNPIPCLDKGYVAQLDSSCISSKLNDIAMEFFKKDDSKFLRSLSSLTVVIKCPLFVQLNLSTHDFHIITVPVVDEVEAYCPNVGEVGSPDLGTNKDIADNIKATTDALLINPKAYQVDGCDRFISQVLTPVSTYTTLIVHGSYNEWRKFCEQPRLPTAIKAYVKAITQLMNTEWRS